MALPVKDSLFRHFQLIECASDFYLFFQIDCGLLGKKVLLGVVYIPRDNSKYSSVEHFNEIENRVVKLRYDEMPICIIGDVMSRDGPK